MSVGDRAPRPAADPRRRRWRRDQTSTDDEPEKRFYQVRRRCPGRQRAVRAGLRDAEVLHDRPVRPDPRQGQADRRRHPDATFINVEPYQLEYVDGALSRSSGDRAADPGPGDRRVGALAEPWVFVVDRHGIVQGSLMLIFGDDELEAAVQAVSSALDGAGSSRGSPRKLRPFAVPDPDGLSRDLMFRGWPGGNSTPFSSWSSRNSRIVPSAPRSSNERTIVRPSLSTPTMTPSAAVVPGGRPSAGGAPRMMVASPTTATRTTRATTNSRRVPRSTGQAVGVMRCRCRPPARTADRRRRSAVSVRPRRSASSCHSARQRIRPARRRGGQAARPPLRSTITSQASMSTPVARSPQLVRDHAQRSPSGRRSQPHRLLPRSAPRSAPSAAP